jgi:hypothetical protein
MRLATGFSAGFCAVYAGVEAAGSHWPAAALWAAGAALAAAVCVWSWGRGR